MRLPIDVTSFSIHSLLYGSGSLTSNTWMIQSTSSRTSLTEDNFGSRNKGTSDSFSAFSGCSPASTTTLVETPPDLAAALAAAFRSFLSCRSSSCYGKRKAIVIGRWSFSYQSSCFRCLRENLLLERIVSRDARIFWLPCDTEPLIIDTK